MTDIFHGGLSVDSSVRPFVILPCGSVYGNSSAFAYGDGDDFDVDDFDSCDFDY